MMKIENNITVAEYNELRKSVGWSYKSSDLVEKAIKNSVIIKKAIIDHEIAGMARVIGDGLYYLICDVVVDPKYQNRRIGQRMIEDIINDIKNQMQAGQKCTVNLVSVKGKEGFYEKCGFMKISFENTGYGMTRIVKK